MMKIHMHEASLGIALICNRCLNRYFTNKRDAFRRTGWCHVCSELAVCNELPHCVLKVKPVQANANGRIYQAWHGDGLGQAKFTREQEYRQLFRQADEIRNQSADPFGVHSILLDWLHGGK